MTRQCFPFPLYCCKGKERGRKGKGRGERREGGRRGDRRVRQGERREEGEGSGLGASGADRSAAGERWATDGGDEPGEEDREEAAARVAPLTRRGV